VACGSGDAQTLAVVSTGLVYSWGDGDYGKLGRGGSDCCKTPKIVQQLENVAVEKVYCGAQFSLALTKDGQVFSWGKGEHYRLGHGNTEHVRFPKKIDSLDGKHVKSLSVGSSHVLALTDSGEIYGWGRNEQGQLGDLVGWFVAEPTKLSGLKGRQIVGMACGPTQSFVWSTNNRWNVDPQIPFVVDVSKNTLLQLNRLLDLIWEGIGEDSEKPPSKGKECIAVSALNLLKLQLYSILSHTFDLENLGLTPGHKILINLREKVVALASQPGVLPSIQSVAQLTLQVGWSLLLPTADERARALSTSLPLSTDPRLVHPGKRFMTDLLVSSLTADGGLDNALETAIKFEVEGSEKVSKGRRSSFFHSMEHSHQWLTEQAQQEVEAKYTSLSIEPKQLNDLQSNSNGVEDHSLPLLNLINQLLKSSSAVTTAQLSDLPAESHYSHIGTSRCTSVGTKTSQNASCTSNHLNCNQYSSCSGYGSLDCPTAVVSKTLNNNDRSPSLSLLLRFQRLLFSRIISIQNNLKFETNTDGKCTIELLYCIQIYAIQDKICR